MTEKQILAEIEHPFLIKMHSSFQDDKKLYFVLEYCPGGELFTLLSIKDKLTEDQ
jgi:serine/threonine protein kinase